MSRDDFLNAESSGGLAGFEFTVDDAFFAIDEKYSEKVDKPTYFLHWVGRSNAQNHEIMDASGFHPKWAVDPDFSSLDQGKTVESPTKGKKLGKAAGRMMKNAAVATKHLTDTPEDFLAGADPRDASIWVGTRWIMDNVETDFGGTIGAITELMPTQFLGTAQQGQQQLAAVPTPPPAAPQAPQAAPAAPQAQTNGNGDIRSEIIALAAQHTDYRVFQAAALQKIQAAGAVTDSALLSDVASEGGIWAQVHGS